MANRPGIEIGSHKVTIVSLQEEKKERRCLKHEASCTLSSLVLIIIDLELRPKKMHKC